MSASQRIQVLSNKSEELSILKEFILNPNLIDSLALEVKKLNSLTFEEEVKLKTAKDMLKNHDSILADLSKRESLLTAAKIAHQAEVKKNNDEQTAIMNGVSESEKSQASKMADLENSLNSKIKAYEEKEKVHARNVKIFEEEKENFIKMHADDRKKIDSESSSLKLEANEMAINKEKVLVLEKKLKDAADKMKYLLST